MEEKNHVLVISSEATFTIKAIPVKLQGIGLNASYSNADIRAVKKYESDTELFIYYMDETVKELADFIVYMKDMLMEHHRRIILIGSKEEYENVRHLIPPEYILEWFERPLQMNDLLQCVGNYMTEISERQKQKSILIVDDDVTYMRMVRSWLKGNYRVAMANSGIQAITFLARNSADLILLDYDMPITSGPTVLEMLRSEAATADIPVMFLTGRGDRYRVTRVMELKPVDYLLKTIDKPQLLAKLANYFNSIEKDEE